MANSLPSFVFAVTDHELPAQFESCWDLGQLVQEKIDAGEAWEATFRNEWHRSALEAAQKARPTPALNYVFTELSLLNCAEIVSAIQSIDDMRAYFLSDAGSLLQIFGEYDRHLDLSRSELYEAACNAKIQKKVIDDNYRTSVEAFFAFLASQRQALHDALRAEKSVIHVQFHG